MRPQTITALELARCAHRIVTHLRSTRRWSESKASVYAARKLGSLGVGQVYDAVRLVERIDSLQADGRVEDAKTVCRVLAETSLAVALLRSKPLLSRTQVQVMKYQPIHPDEERISAAQWAAMRTESQNRLLAAEPTGELEIEMVQGAEADWSYCFWEPVVEAAEVDDEDPECHVPVAVEPVLLPGSLNLPSDIDPTDESGTYFSASTTSVRQRQLHLCIG